MARRRVSQGLTEFETFVDKVYAKWIDPSDARDKEYLTKCIWRCWGNPDKMAWWNVCAEAEWWEGEPSKWKN